MMRSSSMLAASLRLIATVAALPVVALSIGCGGYRKTESADGVLASAWSDGRAVHLVQHYVRQSGFVGLSPHIVDPTTQPGRLAVVLPGGRRIEPSFAEQGTFMPVHFAIARPSGRGFAVGLTGFSGKELCLLISFDGAAKPCGASISFDRHDAGADIMLFRDVAHQTIRMFDMYAGVVTDVSDDFLTLPWSEQRPCDMSDAALSPDRRQWVIACWREGRPGLWLLTRSGELELLVDDSIRLPRSTSDVPVPSFRRYTLAWSPDMRVVHYCDGGVGEAVIVHMTDRRTQRINPCLAFGVISDAPYRIVGSLPTGKAAEGDLNLE